MSELIKNAWLGWTSFKSAGKLVALPMAFLLFIAVYETIYKSAAGFFIENGTEKRRLKVLCIYTAVIMALCIFPVTAAALMLYQTKFYNYEWIWSYVPVTAVTAAGGCFILKLIWRNRYTTPDRIKAGAATLLLAAAVVMCGQPWSGTSDDTSSETLVQYDKTELLISEITELVAKENKNDDGMEKICLWAPQEILEHARQCQSDITLIYGRNMWDNALNAYSYDTYPEEYERLYQWMQLVEQYGEIDYEDKTEDYSIYKDAVTEAIRAGVNVIILPESASEKTRDEVRTAAGVQETDIQGYTIFIII